MRLTESDRFQLRGILGEGGMGVVYEAYDRQRAMHVALKALRHLDALSLYHFKREFRALQNLSHPNIITLYELFCDDEDWFLTMELVDGDDFLTHVRHRRAPVPVGADAPTRTVTSQPAPEFTEETLTSTGGTGDDLPHAGQPPDRTKSVHSIVAIKRLEHALAQLARAVHALHSAGMIHCDLKPSNVLVTPSGRVVLVDFGIVAESSEPEYRMAGNRRIRGTPSFMAPEQARGDMPTPAADWYALGVILYICLTGSRPFGGTATEILAAKQERDPLPPDAFAHDLPDHLRSLCVDLMARDPAARPRGHEVLSRLGVSSDNIKISHPSMDGHGFVGRKKELATLHMAYNRVAQGEFVWAFVHGRAGMGKSALCRQWLAELEADTTTRAPLVLRGRCHERESLSYKAFDGVIDALSNVLVAMPKEEVEEVLGADMELVTRLFPVLSRVENIAQVRPQAVLNRRELRTRAVTALRETFGNLAAIRPIVVFIDNFHWADADSLALLADLFGGPMKSITSRILLLLSLRPTTEVGSNADGRDILEQSIAALTADRTHYHITLGPLPLEEQRQLVTEIVGDVLGGRTTDDSLWTQAEGSPLLLTELARYIVDSAEVDSAATGSNGGPSLPGLDEALYARIKELPRDALALLEVISVASSPMPLWIVATAIDQSGIVRERAAAVLRIAHFVRVVTPDAELWLAPYHDKIRETVSKNLSAERIRDLHHRLAVCLETWDQATNDMRARHWLAAGDRGKAKSYLLAAAAAAFSKLAFEYAADIYRDALDLIDGDSAESFSVMRSMAEALSLGGNCYQASRAYDRAAAHPRATEVVKLRRLAAEDLLRSGRVRAALARLSAIIEELGFSSDQHPSNADHDLTFERAWLQMRGDRDIQHANDAANAAASDELRRLDTLYAISTCLAIVDHARGATIQAHHLHAALECGDERGLCRALGTEIVFLGSQGEDGLQRAEELGRDVIAEGRRLRDPYLLGIACANMGTANLIAGHYAEAGRYYHQAISLLADEVVGAQWELTSSRHLLCVAQMYQGMIAETAPIVERMLEESKRYQDMYGRGMVECTPNTWRLLARDTPRRLIESLDALIRLWPEDTVYMAHYMSAACRTQAHIYLADVDAAGSALEQCRGYARSLELDNVPSVRGEICNLAARISLMRDDDAAAADSAREAGRQGLPMIVGIATATLAAVARRQGEVERARELMNTAVARFRESGCMQYLAATRARIAALPGADGGDRTEFDAWAKREGIVDRERMLAFLAP